MSDIDLGQLQSENVTRLASWIRGSKNITVLTGAGVSTESGVPDYRSKSGWWRTIDPLTVDTVSALMNNYDLFQEFYANRIESLEHVRPNEGHRILSKWERSGFVHAVATQNIDGLHQIAGSKTVFELHGTIRRFKCTTCNRDAELQSFLNKEACRHCGGNLRPNAVLFGESLPRDAWEGAFTAMRRADLVLVIGTRLQVSPVNQLPTMTHGRVAIINMEDTDFDDKFDLVIRGRAGHILEQVNALL